MENPNYFNCNMDIKIYDNIKYTIIKNEINEFKYDEKTKLLNGNFNIYHISDLKTLKIFVENEENKQNK